MYKKLPWIALFTTVFFMLAYVIFAAKLQPAGDIAEYYGITQSLINHGGIDLTQKDQENLSKELHPQYFSDPTYYIRGRDDKRYPVHFIAYSILITPLRLLFLDPQKTLAIGNILIAMATIVVIFKRFVLSISQRLFFLVIFFLSPLLSFLVWPGPDILFISFLLLTLFSFFNKNYKTASIFAILASWHSQPLVPLALVFTAYYVIYKSSLSIGSEVIRFRISIKLILTALFLILLIFLPYAYNYIVFGVLTPWTILQDAWTQTHGIGLHNASLKKLFEQFFDLNIGLFWYAPLLVIGGIYGTIRLSHSNRLILPVFAIYLLTSFFYQTNPAWHYGTSGYGPTRHVLFFIPFLIFIITSAFQKGRISKLFLLTYMLIQIPILAMNNFLIPDFENTLYHNPLAKYVLRVNPGFYNPTPEIFVDRTNHTDLKYPTSAIYKLDNKCKKAYILPNDMEYLRENCGFIPPLEGDYVNYNY